MVENPLEIFEGLDPELLSLVENTRDFALTEGALPRKVKLLIAMALDASQGAVEGVKTLAQKAMQTGATKQEIAEALRIAYYICGVGSIYTTANALKDLL
ncbi:MAG: carboxymuconolactone decarboxylase family protein [Candidatus Bathyarchaeia archaeon]